MICKGWFKKYLGWFFAGVFFAAAVNAFASFSITWDETTPVDHTKFQSMPGYIRNLKTAVRERFQHGGGYWPSGHDESAGEWNYTLYREQGSTPSTVANKGSLYTKDVGGITELYYVDSAGTATKITSNGAINDTAAGIKMPSGMVFMLLTGSCPSGSTDITATYTGMFARINATPASTGGADTHHHTNGSMAVSGTTGTSDSNGDHAGPDAFSLALPGHRHTFSASVSGTMDDASNVPPYFTVILCEVT